MEANERDEQDQEVERPQKESPVQTQALPCEKQTNLSLVPKTLLFLLSLSQPQRKLREDEELQEPWNVYSAWGKGWRGQVQWREGKGRRQRNQEQLFPRGHMESQSLTCPCPSIHPPRPYAPLLDEISHSLNPERRRGRGEKDKSLWESRPTEKGERAQREETA